MKADASHFQGYSESDVVDRLAQLKIRIAGRLHLGLSSKSMRYGLRRDLTIPHSNPSVKIPIAVRPLESADLSALLGVHGTEGDAGEMLEIAWRRAFVDKGAKGCFVAVDQRSGVPCYMQWLFSSSDNQFIKGLGGFPELGPQEALLENAYTPVSYRGLGIMSAAMALIAERAADFDARYVLTFVDQHNAASLKGCQRAGFYPHMLHHRTQMGFGLIKHDSFEELPDPAPTVEATRLTA